MKYEGDLCFAKTVASLVLWIAGFSRNEKFKAYEEISRNYVTVI